uniref:Ig-like domain-containing protein n=1 Tax=Oryzias latipes TaxID=8090 RepID=H2MK79_ORYLA
MFHDSACIKTKLLSDFHFLFFAMTGSSVVGQPDCVNGFCISVSDEKISADSGLCVVIPCSFQTPYNFNLQHLVWFKCESDQRCGDSDMIFHTNKNTNKPLKSGFLGRVSLLDPDLNQNCSIIISDLRESDSGFYQLRVNGKINERSDGFTFLKKTHVDVGDLKEEITAESGLCVVIPCSFQTPSSFKPQHLVWFKCESDQKCSDPDIIFHTNKKNIKSEFLGRVSLLDPEVKNQNCSIIISDVRESDSGFYQTEIKLLENYFSKPTVTLPDLTVGHQATLTCTAPALCSKSPPGITWMWRGAETLTAVTQRHYSTLTFIPTTEHHNSKITCRIQFSDEITTEKTVNLHAMPQGLSPYMRKPQISGKVIVKEGEVLNLTCSVDSFPPAVWTGLWSNLHNGSDHSGSATLIVTNVTAEDSGRYFCAANHQNWTETVHVDVTVMLEGSACVRRSDVLTCTCIGTGFPLPNIKFLFSLFSQIHDGLTVAEDPNCLPEGAENEAVSTGEAAPKLRSGSGDVEYASIDFSLLKRRERTQELQTAATEYAEVKVKKEGKHAAGEEEAMMEEDDKTLLCVSKKDAEEEVVYSSVNDLMDEI